MISLYNSCMFLFWVFMVISMGFLALALVLLYFSKKSLKTLEANEYIKQTVVFSSDESDKSWRETQRKERIQYVNSINSPKPLSVER
jgi:membrane peptidoglycan carboxypeptidase